MRGNWKACEEVEIVGCSFKSSYFVFVSVPNGPGARRGPAGPRGGTAKSPGRDRTASCSPPRPP